MSKIAVIIILLFTSFSLYSQDSISKCTVNIIIRSAEGDLNGDGLIDHVIISMDTVSETIPLRLEIFFAQSDGGFKLFFSSTTIIEAQYPIELNGKHCGNTIPNVDIIDGNLEIEFYLKGISIYKFRYTENNFLLSHFSTVHYDGIVITEIEFDLVSGRFSKLMEILESSEVTEKTEKKILIRPLPTIQEFKPFENGTKYF